ELWLVKRFCGSTLLRGGDEQRKQYLRTSIRGSRRKTGIVLLIAFIGLVAAGAYANLWFWRERRYTESLPSLGSSTETLAVKAIWALARLGDERARAALIERLLRTSESDPLRLDLIAAVVETGASEKFVRQLDREPRGSMVEWLTQAGATEI